VRGTRAQQGSGTGRAPDMVSDAAYYPSCSKEHVAMI